MTNYERIKNMSVDEMAECFMSLFAAHTIHRMLT